jgi:hypothetical protein
MLEPTLDPVAKVEQWFKSTCRGYADQGQHLTGFKFKPYIPVLDDGRWEDERYERLWDWFEKHDVAVVYNHRNDLDRCLAGVWDASSASYA